MITKLTTNHYVDVQGWNEDKIKKAAEMFSEHTGLDIWSGVDALHSDTHYHYLLVNSGHIMVTSGTPMHCNEVNQHNFNKLLEEWVMHKQTSSVMNCDYVYTKDLSTQQYEMLGDALVKAGFVGEYPDNIHHYHEIQDWVFGVDCNGENNHGMDSTSWFNGGRQLSFEQFMQNLKTHSQEAVIPLIGSSIGVNINDTETATSDDKASLVQRITLAHKAALQACQEAVETYNTYKNAVDELKEEVGEGFKIEEVKWEDMFDIPSNTLKEIPSPEEWQEDDIVECVEEGRNGFTVGNQYTLADIVDDDGDVFVKEDDVGDHYYIQTSKLKWISRPQ